MKAEENRKPLYARVLHWSLVVLFIIAFATAYRAFDYSISMPIKQRDGLFAVHRLSGLLAGILLLVWFVILVKSNISKIRNGLSFRPIWVFHFCLGVACFILPVLPWIARSREGRTSELYLLIPHFNSASPPTTDFVYKLLAEHIQLAEIIIALLVLHLAGVVFHQFFLKDKTLRNMWFGKK